MRSLLAALEGFFAEDVPLEPGDGLVVAFSGGPDSTALLVALTEWERRPALTAAHFDHALDPGSAARAQRARSLATSLRVPFVQTRRPVAALRRRGESPEAAARRLRYDFLERVRTARGARWVATAHHRDDQAETVLLRLLQGTGLAGLAAIAPRRSTLVRPLLALERAELAAWSARRGLHPVEDPTNRDLRSPRSLARHRLLPALENHTPALRPELARLAGTADAARRAIHRRLGRALAPHVTENGVEIERRRLESLPAALQGPALALLHRLAGAEHPPTAAARRELARQLRRGGEVGCDLGAGWAMTSTGKRLHLRREAPAAAPFAYTLAMPGEVELPAGVGTLRLSRRAAEAWMFRPSTRRAGLSLALDTGDRIIVRSRRPGDRIRPLGCSHNRLLKNVLIDRKVPRRERDRLPLLCLGRRVVWVPGITIAEECRLDPGAPAWVAEWERR